MIKALVFALLLVSCIEYNMNPIEARHSRLWNSEVLLTGAEIPQVPMIGVKLVIPDLEIAYCAYDPGWCVDNETIINQLKAIE